uniref:Endo/exonuclease/phosphatase domain-containing protein n=1 Tax=Angiostrongylus cantonensis TaxID=6313 RepID=A0A0K0D099_ANGCA
MSTKKLLKSQGQWKLPGSRKTMVTICTYNVRTLACELWIEDLLKQARRIRYDIIGLSETRRRHPINAVYDTEEEMFLGTCDS